MRQLKIGGRLNLVSVAALAGLVLVLTLSLFRLSSVMHADVGDKTRQQVESAYSLVAHYADEARAGRMTDQQAQAAALGALRALRYNGREYFWVNDMSPRMLMHPFKPEMEGKDLADTKDGDGKPVFVNMVEVVRGKGEGFVKYNWDKPGSNTPQPKISYVKGFSPWGWVIGTGVYVDDISAAVWRAALLQGGLVLIVILAVGGLVTLLGRSISRPLKGLTDRMGTLAKGDTHSDIPGLHRADEMGEMARALEVFRDAAVAKEKAEAAKAKAEAEQEFVVTTVSELLAGVSQGDLTADIRVEFPPAYAALRENYNTALSNLRDLVAALSVAAESIRTGSDEIANASNDLARRTEGNAASLEETSASLSQMEARLRSTAAAAGRTVEQTNGAVGTVGRGRETADEAVAAMNRVSESARGIDSVIEGLDKIAFQTRVLAMNAAVEAGRAGEAGRGFAVVADLVSALAMRSEEEAKRAREQLTATQTDIVMAVGAVENVDGALANISGSVAQVHELVATMAEDNQAQSTTISQISDAVNTMDRATQQNAAMVEQTSAAARTLANEVEGLAERAGRFRIGDDTAPANVRALRKNPSPPVTIKPVPAVASVSRPHAAADQGDWSSF